MAAAMKAPDIGTWRRGSADCLEAVERVTGGCLTFWDQEKIRRIGAFPLHSHIAGPWYWNFADCDAKPMMDGERIYAYGRHTGNPALCALGAAMGTPIIPRDTPQMNRVLDALFRAPTPCPYPEAEKTGIAAPAPGICEAMGNTLCCLQRRSQWRKPQPQRRRHIPAVPPG